MDNIRAVTDFLFIGKKKEDIEPCSLVLVLGNIEPRGTMEEIADLYQRGLIRADARIILSGATGRLNAGGRKECDLMYEYATEEFHMPEELFLKEPHATNARENFSFSRELILQEGGFERFDRILCVGTAFLSRRASMYAAALSYPTEKMQYYGIVERDGRDIGPDTWWKSEVAKERVMAEVERIGKYYLSGYLSLNG